MSTALEKILKLAKKTGDNVIVFNPAKPNDSYVILALNSYERLVDECGDCCGLTEDDLDDKINPEIAPWERDEDDHENRWEDDDQWPDEQLADDEEESGVWQHENNFLPDEIFDGQPAAGDESAEDKWEEEVNYLYPTEEEFAAMAQAQTRGQNDNFNSVADILEDHRDKKAQWPEPAVAATDTETETTNDNFLNNN